MLDRPLNKVLFCAAWTALLAVAAPHVNAQNTLPWQTPAANETGSAYGAAPYGGHVAANDAYQPENSGGSSGYDGYESYNPTETYDNNGTYGNDAYRPAPDANSAYQPGGPNDSFSPPPQSEPGYGAPYSPPPQGPEVYERDYGEAPPPSGGYQQNEIIGAGHQFFGSVSQGIASAVEYAFQSQGRPNGYILGEDAGGALIVGLRYGEGTLYTKNAGNHKVYWQGPSLGYDAGAEGSKVMVLVYNLEDTSEIYHRFGGVQGSAYLVGGASVQFQKYDNVTLAVIRSGVGLRLGANVGYLKYTRTPTWNPL